MNIFNIVYIKIAQIHELTFIIGPYSSISGFLVGKLLSQYSKSQKYTIDLILNSNINFISLLLNKYSTNPVIRYQQQR